MKQVPRKSMELAVYWTTKPTPILLEKEIPNRQFSVFLHLNPSYF